MVEPHTPQDAESVAPRGPDATATPARREISQKSRIAVNVPFVAASSSTFDYVPCYRAYGEGVLYAAPPCLPTTTLLKGHRMQAGRH